MTWDPIWEKMFRSRPWGKYPSEPLIRFVARNFYAAPDRSQIRLCELGCGPGANLWYMAREGFSVFGIDGSETAIHIARERLNAECPGWTGELQTGDFVRLPYPDGVFDGVIDHEGFCCASFEDAKAAYREVWRVLKPGGKFFSRAFATGCVGEGTGEPAGYNAWYVTKGPTADEGLVRFTALEDIEVLLGALRQTSLELATWTMNDRQDEVREWLIEAVKEHTP
jgi:SAM-dependent methyltransferase